MYHIAPSRSACCVLVTNAVHLILNMKRQTSYWTFVQCLNVAGDNWVSSQLETCARAQLKTTHENGSWIDEGIVAVSLTGHC